MFTGIIEAMAEVKERNDSQLKVSRPQLFVDIAIGSSISVSGTCLSVVSFDETSMTFDVIPETFKCTKLGSLEERDKVNLERAMLATDRFEGHVVQGHVESVGVASIPRSLAPTPTTSPSSTHLRQGYGWQAKGGELRFDESSSERKDCWYNKEQVNEVVLKYARGMRQNPTDAEAVLWEALRGDQLEGFSFRRQHPLGTKILDFYCHKARLGIEVDGEIHKRKDVQECDRGKEIIFGDRKIKLIRFTNNEVLHHLPRVLEQITKSIQGPPSPCLPIRSPEAKVGGRGAGGEGNIRGVEVYKKNEESMSGGEITIEVPTKLLKFITPKGSISIDGVSLTVASVKENKVTVALIPHTLENTTLGLLRDGDFVNIETDVMVRSLLAQ
ncbi:DUF559 domain-containing protein [Patescibacteria group bacterium]|nr:DUF559 domain-containing protein [Patescibacteria group bacterium]